MNFIKLRVKVHRYIDRSLAVFHGPRVLARYCCNGHLLAKENEEIVAVHLILSMDELLKNTLQISTILDDINPDSLCILKVDSFKC